MLRFNIAFLPEDQEIQNFFRGIAHKYYENNQDGYLLGPDALAHVTVCQFYSKSEDDALKAFHAFNGAGHMETLQLIASSVRAGETAHVGYWWADYAVEKTPTLLGIQKKCAQSLISRGIEVLTQPETYYPHFTLSRLSQKPVICHSMDDLGNIKEVKLRLALGCSTQNGVFLRQLNV